METYNQNHLQEYIHRVGRTARGLEGKGNALLFLNPEEMGFLQFLREYNIPVSEFTFSWNKVLNIQSDVLTIYVIFDSISAIIFFSHI